MQILDRFLLEIVLSVVLIVLGYLNPDRALSWNLGEEDELVVLSTYE